MADNHVIVNIAEGDEQQLADMMIGDSVDFEGSLNGQPIVVRFYLKELDDDEDEDGISPEATALGHKYVMGVVNAYCPKCSEIESEKQGRPIVSLTCDYDTNPPT